MILFLEGNDHDQEAAHVLLREHGFTVSMRGGKVPESLSSFDAAAEDLPTAFLEHCIDGILIIDVETIGVLYANHAFADMLGYSMEEIRHTKVWEWEAACSREEIKRAYATRNWPGERFETQYRRLDGRVVHVSVSHKPIFWKGKEVVFCVVKDITERKRTERVLHLTQFTVEKAGDQAFWMTPEGRFLYVNEAACTALGYSREELKGMPIWEIDPNVTREKAIHYWLHLKETGVMRFESLHRAKDGHVYPVEVRGNYVNFEGQEYSCVFVTDITERKKEEQALRLNQFAVDKTAEQAFWISPDGQIIYANNAACESLGYSHEELVGMSLSDIDPDCSGEAVAASWNILKKEKVRRFECFHKARDGRIYPVEIRSNYVNYDGQEFRFAFVTDISERKRAEEALHESERKYRSIVENAPFGISRSNREGELLSANPAFASILQYDSPEELLKMVNRSSIQEVLFPNPADREPLVENILADDAWTVFNNTLRCKNGDLVTCRIHSRRILDENGQVGEFESYHENITKQLEAELALQESEEKFRVLTETSPAAICLYQGERIFYANPAMTRLLGYSAAELYREKFWAWGQGESQSLIRRRGLARLAGEENLPNQYEARFLSKSGEVLDVMISAGTMEYQGRFTGVASFLDITERKKAEALIRASLEEKDVLLREIHHRVKNNLQVISSLLYLQSHKFTDPEVQKCFLESQSRICSMALAHEQLYQSKNLAEVSINSYLKNLLQQQREIFSSSEQEVDCRMLVEDISLDIEKVVPCGLLLTELLSNTFKHAFVDGRSGQVNISLRSVNGKIELTVADNGVGLPVGFDYRHAKTLGLQLVAALVNQLDGVLEVEGNAGAQFRVRFAG